MKVSRVLVPVTLLALLGACASLPSPEEGNRTLLALVVRNEGITSSEQLGYAFGLAENDQRLEVSPQNGVVVFSHLAPGTYTINRYYVTSGMVGNRFIGSREPYALKPLSFKLVAGSITILPFTLVVSEEVKGQVIMQANRFEPTNRDQALALLARRGSLERWRVAD